MKAINKKARFDYEILKTFEAGIVLAGHEVKAIRAGKASINNAYARIMGGEAYLINANIPVEGVKDYNPTKNRKLLLHKKEITEIMTEIKAKNLTLIPLSLYNTRALFKVELALAKPKRKYQKKQVLQKRDTDRDTERELLGRDEKLKARN